MKKRVRAILVDKNNNLVLIKRVMPNQEYWVFPGGGIEEGETQKDALKRECEEEVGVKVSIGDLITERLIDRNDGTKEIEFFYSAKVIEGTVGTGKGPEFQEESGYEGTHEIYSVPFAKLGSLQVLPEEIKKIVINKYEEKHSNS